MLFQMERDPGSHLVYSTKSIFLYKVIDCRFVKISREGLVTNSYDFFSPHNWKASPYFQIQAFLSHSQSPSNLFTLHPSDGILHKNIP